MERDGRPPNGTKRGHRGFAALWDFATRHEGKSERAARARVVGGAHGRVLELGVGVGTNWEFLPQGVDYSGIDPDEFMLTRAQRHAAASGRKLDVRLAAAEKLPFADATFDTVFVTLTLCSVGDVVKSLAESQRVMKAGGEFRFFEHVRSEGRVAGRVMRIIAPAWRRAAGGCNVNNQSLAAIQGAGFTDLTIERMRLGGLPAILGSARKRS